MRASSITIASAQLLQKPRVLSQNRFLLFLRSHAIQFACTHVTYVGCVALWEHAVYSLKYLSRATGPSAAAHGLTVWESHIIKYLKTFDCSNFPKCFMGQVMLRNVYFFQLLKKASNCQYSLALEHFSGNLDG